MRNPAAKTTGRIRGRTLAGPPNPVPGTFFPWEDPPAPGLVGGTSPAMVSDQLTGVPRTRDGSETRGVPSIHRKSEGSGRWRGWVPDRSASGKCQKPKRTPGSPFSKGIEGDR